MAKSLIVYFSRKGQNYSNGSIKSLAKGNTEAVAEMIAAAVGGDLFEVERTEPYPENYDACTREAQREAQEKARPALVKYLDSIDAYDTIFVGYPNWWGTMPMPVFSFLERYDFTGKRVAPFCTHEGSGLGKSEKDVRTTCAGAEVGKGLAVKGSQAAESAASVTRWAKAAAERA
ncbi:hypothetical protein HMPREF7545_0152 [Selenomonas noxia ATCC 43541]|uniref:flavodoxin n=1 Tax=Selenomonas noxia TaxID=135083 RepID=UPI0001BCD055|nr:flavodoxin [Selenomonas noxia]EFF67212.1 hypothetical protein HMPREF7545_0152 [Selenomonas noxia ATCC 43541]